jgi:hypothetical protein
VMCTSISWIISSLLIDGDTRPWTPVIESFKGGFARRDFDPVSKKLVSVLVLLAVLQLAGACTGCHRSVTFVNAAVTQQQH